MKKLKEMLLTLAESAPTSRPTEDDQNRGFCQISLLVTMLIFVMGFGYSASASNQLKKQIECWNARGEGQLPWANISVGTVPDTNTTYILSNSGVSSNFTDTDLCFVTVEAKPTEVSYTGKSSAGRGCSLKIDITQRVPVPNPYFRPPLSLLKYYSAILVMGGTGAPFYSFPLTCAWLNKAK